MTKSVTKKKLRDLFVPFLIFFGYLVLSVVVFLIFQNMDVSPFIQTILTDGLVCVLLGVPACVYAFKHRPGPDEERVKFSAFGWLMILFTFCCMYVTAEGLGNWIRVIAPIGLTDTYTEMTTEDLYMYLAMAVTVGPIAGELIFRRYMFRVFRNSFSFWPSSLMSSVLFTVFHGTAMHIPVTMALLLFLTVLYEVTGRFRLCMIFHILFNYMGATFLFDSHATPPVMIVCYGLVVAAMVLSYVFRDFVFGKMLRAGGIQQFESYLDEKRKHFGEPKDQSDDRDTKS